MSEVDGRFVKQGIWTNLDKGEVMGRTITTDTRTGIFIIAIMAVMSTIGECDEVFLASNSDIGVVIRNFASLESHGFRISSSSSYWESSRRLTSSTTSSLEDAAPSKLADS